jgi:hypothetical protein
MRESVNEHDRLFHEGNSDTKFGVSRKFSEETEMAGITESKIANHPRGRSKKMGSCPC